MSSQTSVSDPPAHTFAGLVHGIIQHPLFPLAVHKTRALVCGDENAAPVPQKLEPPHLAASTLKTFAEKNGLDRACERWTSTDVFMSAFVSALADVPPKQMPTEVQTLLNRGNALNSEPIVFKKPDRIIRKTSRTAVSERGKAALERWFQQHLDNPYPTVVQKEQLAKECSMTLSSVNNWFGNKRMRIKRKMLSVEGGTITDQVLAPRSKWNAVVVSKMNSPVGREVVESAMGINLLPTPPPKLDQQKKPSRSSDRQKTLY